MDKPKLKLNGKTYSPIKPKVKLWRRFVKFQEGNPDDGEDSLDTLLQLISDAYGEEVTPDLIEEHLDLEDLLPTFRNISQWFGENYVRNIKVDSKNEEAPAEE